MSKIFLNTNLFFFSASIMYMYVWISVIFLYLSAIQIKAVDDDDQDDVPTVPKVLIGRYVGPRLDEFEQLAQYLFGDNVVLKTAILFQSNYDRHQQHVYRNNTHSRTANDLIELIYKLYHKTVVQLSSTSQQNTSNTIAFEVLTSMLTSIDEAIKAKPLTHQMFELLNFDSKLAYAKLKYYADVQQPPRTIESLNHLDQQVLLTNYTQKRNESKLHHQV